jgi:hypothetical protein
MMATMVPRGRIIAMHAGAEFVSLAAENPVPGVVTLAASRFNKYHAFSPVGKTDLDEERELAA